MITDKEDILEVVADLARSQGFYGVLLDMLKTDDALLTRLANQKFSSVFDLIMFLENDNE